MCQIITEQCTFVINGAWNTAIIQPDWLRSQFPTLIPSELEILFIPGNVRLLRYDLGNITLEPNNNRLIFIPKKIDDETLDYIAKLSTEIQRKLPHTPISAAGANYFFELDENEYFCIPGLENIEELKDHYKDFVQAELTSKVLRHTFSFSDHQLNIDFRINHDTKIVQYNYHYKLSEPIEMASKSLKNNLNYSEKLNKKLIQSN